MGMKCEKCGNEISYVKMLRFNYDGSDDWIRYTINEEENIEAVYIDADCNWTGCGLSEEEQMDTIICPDCEQFPFEHKEVQTYEILRVVCFKKGGAE